MSFAVDLDPDAMPTRSELEPRTQDSGEEVETILRHLVARV